MQIPVTLNASPIQKREDGSIVIHCDYDAMVAEASAAAREAVRHYTSDTTAFDLIVSNVVTSDFNHWESDSGSYVIFHFAVKFEKEHTWKVYELNGNGTKIYVTDENNKPTVFTFDEMLDTLATHSKFKSEFCETRN